MSHITDQEVLEERRQATLLYARERRENALGELKLFRTHRFRGASVMAVPAITMGTFFPDRTKPMTFKTKIRIHADGSVATEHRGLVFELGGLTIGTAVWVEDDKIGFATGTSTAAEQASGTFDYGTEIPPGLVLTLVLAVNVSTGLGMLWGNGKLLARDVASGGDLGTTWAGTGPGSFADAVNANTLATVPVASLIAPDGFDVIEPLSVYHNQVPREFR